MTAFKAALVNLLRANGAPIQCPRPNTVAWYWISETFPMTAHDQVFLTVFVHTCGNQAVNVIHV